MWRYGILNDEWNDRCTSRKVGRVVDCLSLEVLRWLRATNPSGLIRLLHNAYVWEGDRRVGEEKERKGKRKRKGKEI